MHTGVERFYQDAYATKTLQRAVAMLTKDPSACQ